MGLLDASSGAHGEVCLRERGRVLGEDSSTRSFFFLNLSVCDGGAFPAAHPRFSLHGQRERACDKPGAGCTTHNGQ